MSFSELGLSAELLRALKPKSYPSPTPVQRAVIPAALGGQDIWVTAPTGSGKTAAFALPLIDRITRTADFAALDSRSNTKLLHSLVLVPTRELAIQVGQTFLSLSAHLGKRCKVTVVFGGVSINPQMMGLRGGQIF